MNKENVDIEIILYFEEWVSYFNEYYSLLLDRYERFKELRASGNSFDAETYLDIIIVQLRSLMLDKRGNKESGVGSYTFQNICALADDKNAANRLDDLINSVLIPGVSSCDECLVGYDCPKSVENCPVMEDLTLGEGIKIIADRTICHYDNYYRKNRHKWEYIQLLKDMLYDENKKVNIDYVINTLKSLFHERIKINWNSID